MHYTLIDLPVHGEEIEPSLIFLAGLVMSYDQLFRRL